MSCEIDISSENIINVESESNIEIAGPSIEIDINKVPEYEIVVDKKEYIITGDNIYIPEYYDDAPQWLKDLVQVVTDVSIETNNGALIGNLNSIISEFANQYVPLNQFTQSILALNTEDERINAFITTLNSNFDSGLNEANAQIINLNLTKASKDEAEAIAIDTISAQLDTPSSKLGSTIGSIQQAIVNTNSASATSYDAIMSTLESADDAIIAQASANELLRTYVGMTEAGAYANQGLSAYLVDSTTGTIGGANSNVANSAWVSGGVAQTKWAYDSTISVGGTTYAAGFGLSNSTGTGIGSEFWIDASRLKFTNSNKTGSKAPFTIDASGTEPHIKFNGFVDFTNVNGVPQSNQVFVQTTVPTSGMIKGDMWINTSTVSNEVSTYNGSAWLKSAGGNKTFSQAAAPTEGLLVGDLWIDTDDNNKYYRWNGSSWIEYIQNPALLINAGTTTINGGKITTGSITAGQIAASTITATEIATKGITADRIGSTTGNSTVWYGGGLVSANFNGNAHGNIGSPTSGFRLSSNAAGTSTDPNIYGAYIKASTMEFLYAGIPGTNNSGRFNYSVTASGGGAVTLVSPAYGSGYANNRITSLQNSILTITVTIPYTLRGTETQQFSSKTGYIQRSINSEEYVNVASEGTDLLWAAMGRITLNGNFVITYVENLANLGNFDILSYRASGGGTILATLNN